MTRTHRRLMLGVVGGLIVLAGALLIAGYLVTPTYLRGVVG